MLVMFLSIPDVVILTTQHEENDKQVVSLSSGGVDYLNGHVNVIPHVVELSILE